MLGFQKLTYLQGGGPCVGISKTDIFYKEYPYISLKYHFKNAEKEGGVICKEGLSVGNSTDMFFPTHRSKHWSYDQTVGSEMSSNNFLQAPNVGLHV